MDQNQEIETLAREYAKLGRTTGIFVGILVGIGGILAGPGLVEFARSLPSIYESSKQAPAAAVYSAMGGVVAAILGVLAAVSGPVLMLLLAKFLKDRTHYTFCKRAATYLSFYKPCRPLLIEKTLNLLETESVRKSFRQG